MLSLDERMPVKGLCLFGMGMRHVKYYTLLLPKYIFYSVNSLLPTKADESLEILVFLYDDNMHKIHSGCSLCTTTIYIGRYIQKEQYFGQNTKYKMVCQIIHITCIHSYAHINVKKGNHLASRLYTTLNMCVHR